MGIREPKRRPMRGTAQLKPDIKIIHAKVYSSILIYYDTHTERYIYIYTYTYIIYIYIYTDS